MNQQGRKYERLRDVVPRKQENPAETVRDLLQISEKQIVASLPRHMDADRMAHIAMTTFQNNKDLQKCDPISFVSAVIEASQLGLEIESRLGQAYLIPFWNAKLKKLMVQLIIGYKGLIVLAKRTENVTDIATGVVHEKDIFDFQRGTEEYLKHIPCLKGNPGPPYAAWCVVKFKNGTPHFEVMSIDEVNKIRDEHGKSTAWENAYEEMVRKTLVRRTTKYVELSPEYNRAVTLENAIDAGEDQGLVLDHMSGVIDVTDYQEQESEEDLAKQLLEDGGFSLLKQPPKFQEFVELSASNLDTDSMGVLRQATSDQTETEEFWRAFRSWKGSAATTKNENQKPENGNKVTKTDNSADSDEPEMSTKDQWDAVDELCKKLGVKKLDVIKEYTGQYAQKNVTLEQADKIITALGDKLAERDEAPEQGLFQGDKSPKDIFFDACNETKAHPQKMIEHLFPGVKSMTDKQWSIGLAACYLAPPAFEFAAKEFSDGAYRLATAAHAWGVKDQDTSDKFMQQAQDRDWLSQRLAEVK